MKLNYFSLTAKTAIAAVVMAAGATVFAQTGQFSVKEFDLTPTVTMSTTHAGQSQKDRIDASGLRPSEVADLPKFQNRPQSIMRSVETPRGNVYAAVNRYEEMLTYDQAYCGSLNLTTGALVPQFYSSALNKFGDDYSMQAVSYRKGEVIAPEYGIENMNGFTGVRWSILDLATGRVNAIYEFKDGLANPYSMTYDPDKDLFYLVSFDNKNGAHSMFGIVDPNGEEGWTYISGQKLADSTGSNQPYIPAIAYNPVDKKIYAFDNHYGVYTIEYEMHASGQIIDDAILVEVGETSVEELDNPYIFDCDPDYGIISGAVTYSPMDEMFVTVFRDNLKQQNRIVYIHPETFEGFVGKTLDPADHFVNGVFCIDEVADADAPELAAEPTAVFDKQNLTGEIRFTTPKFSFVGVDITGSPLECVTVIDGTEVDSRTVKAGDNYVLPITLAQGQHRLEYTTSLNGKVSPARIIGFYVGYDSPVAPKDVAINANVVSWSASGNDGYHFGYVDMADLGYNIYLDGELQNSTPVKGTSFTLNVPETMKRYVIGVTAISQGQESPVTEINPIFGKAFELPFNQVPTRDEVACFDFYNENHDTAIFRYGVHSEIYPGLSFQCGYFNDADDWLILPLVHLPNNESLYEFGFTLRGQSPSYTNEAYEVYVSKQPEPQNMVKGLQVYSTPEEKVHGLIPSEKRFTFAVPEAGDYYVGL
ncbi:MAG: hypothetical protein K2J15_03280, partial [Muribaculaceae bacterium]|nr:hypothetical protein [Muribaculaceae bacterium]